MKKIMKVQINQSLFKKATSISCVITKVITKILQNEIIK